MDRHDSGGGGGRREVVQEVGGVGVGDQTTSSPVSGQDLTAPSWGVSACWGWEGAVSLKFSHWPLFHRLQGHPRTVCAACQDLELVPAEKVGHLLYMQCPINKPGGE